MTDRIHRTAVLLRNFMHSCYQCESLTSTCLRASGVQFDAVWVLLAAAAPALTFSLQMKMGIA